MLRWSRLRAFLLLILALLTGIGATPWSAIAQLDRDVRDRVVPAAIEIAASVIWRENDVEMVIPLPIGSGTVVSADGLILTNHHVVDTAELEALIATWAEEVAPGTPSAEAMLIPDRFLILVSDGVNPPRERFTARIVEQDAALDLAVLRIIGDAEGGAVNLEGGEVSFVSLGDSDAVGLGDRVHVFSYPAIGGDALTYTGGVVSGFQRADGIEGVAWITTDAVMSGGSSGGTAVNDAGELIGIPTQGSELDCRPGDTNRDGAIDVNDIGCIPTGGSLGQLRPVNLAKPLLAAAGGQQVSEAGQSLNARDHDLPRLALKPIDLARLGFQGYAVDWGQLTDAAGAPQSIGIDSTWSSDLAAAGLQEVYQLRMVAPADASGAPGSVTTIIWEYADAAGAEVGFDLLERQIEATMSGVDQATAVSLGDESDLTTWTLESPQGGEPRHVAELTIRVENLVAAVRVIAPASDSGRLRADTERLATALAALLEHAVYRAPETSPGLSAVAVRLLDGDAGGGGDYYLIDDGAAVPLWWYAGANLAQEWTDYWREVGVLDAYETEIYLPIDSESSDPRKRAAVRLYQFTSPENASEFVQAFDEDLQASGATSLNERIDAPHFGDESRSFSFETDWWNDVDPEFRAATVIRAGDIVAAIEIGATTPPPAPVIDEIAAAQAACLETGCASVAIPAPAWLLEESRRTGLLGGDTLTPAVPSQPSPTPQLSPTPRPSPTAEPTAIPAPTSAPTVWGIDDAFDDPAFQPEGTATSTIAAGDGLLVITITEAGGLDGFILDTMPAEGRDFALRTDIVSTSGWGEITLSVGTVDGDSEWFFAVDPVASEWSLYRTSIYTSELFYWVEPRSFAALAPGPITSLEVQVVNGEAVLLINGVDVVSPTGIAMPDMPGNLVAGFGAGINPYSLSGSGDTFTVEFDRVQLFEIGS